MADLKPASRIITQDEYARMIAFVAEWQPVSAADVAKHVGRSSSGLRRILNRDPSFTIERTDDGKHLYSITPKNGPYDVRFPPHFVFRHRQPQWVSRKCADRDTGYQFGMFAIVPTFIRREADPSEYSIQSPRMQAAA